MFVMLASFLHTIVAIWVARTEEPSGIATAIILVHTVLTPQPLQRVLTDWPNLDVLDLPKVVSVSNRELH
jgi:hypothetical protein